MVRVTGRVVERFTKRPISGATVNIGGAVGYTDASGNFSVEANQGKQDLSITAVGYNTWYRAMNFKRALNRVGVLTMDSEIRAL